MFTFKAGIPILACTFVCFPALAQESSDPFSAVPYRNPQTLQQLADLSDAQFQNLVQENNGERFRAIVAGFDPPGQSVFPVSHGFEGSKEACLRARIATACRLYTVDLLEVQRGKEHGAAAASHNPFGTPAN